MPSPRPGAYHLVWFALFLLTLACFAATAPVAATPNPLPALPSFVPALETAPASSLEATTPPLRGDNTLVVLPQGKARAHLLLRGVVLDKSRSAIRYQTMRENGRHSGWGTCLPGREKSVRLPEGECAAIALHAGENAVTAQVREGYHGLLASREAPAHLAGPCRLYFLVPRGVRGFALHARGDSPEERLALQVFTPTGQQAATGATPAEGETTLHVTVGATDAGQLWSLAIDKPEGATLASGALWLSGRLPPILAASPETLTTPFIHYTAEGALCLTDNEAPARVEAVITVPPQPDCLVRAALYPANSGRALWDTKPTSFATGPARIVLPRDIPTGAYTLKTALLRDRVRLVATHTLPLVIAQGFAHLGGKQPLLTIEPSVTDGSLLRVRSAVDPAHAAAMRVRLAFYREGQGQVVFQQDLADTPSEGMKARIPTALPQGTYRIIASLIDKEGRVLASAAHRTYLPVAGPAAR